MKRFTMFMAVAIVLVGCGAPKAEILSYSSDSLGLTFDYPSVSYGEVVVVVEEGDTVSLETGGVSIAGMSVKMMDSSEGEMVARLNQMFLNNSEACSVEELSVTEDKEVYRFDSHVFPFGDEFDANCLLTSNIYYFPTHADKVVVVGSGQAALFETQEFNSAFFDSIKFLP